MPRFFRFLFLALPVLVYAVNSPCRGEDTAAVNRLVKQLGSRNFKQRENAGKALESIGYPALDALRAAAKGKDAEIASRAARLVRFIENSLDLLLAEYQAYGLPLPPTDAKLVRFYAEVWIDKEQCSTLGFLLQPGTEETPPLVLVGTQET